MKKRILKVHYAVPELEDFLIQNNIGFHKHENPRENLRVQGCSVVKGTMSQGFQISCMNGTRERLIQLPSHARYHEHLLTTEERMTERKNNLRRSGMVVHQKTKSSG